MPESGLYLGKLTDGGELLLDPGDLTTHAVIVGMTGSGKTGLGIVLLEEALLRGIPALILDPKGDMGNLALTFPDLAAASFRPWIDDAAAREAGVTADELAQQTAERWRRGLAEHGIGPERIEQLRAAADVTLYTPGSEAGVPLNVIGSLQAPTLSWDEAEETIRDEIEGTVSGLLGLVGIDADPLGSREHVLLANLIEHSWRDGRRPRPGHADRPDPDTAGAKARRLRRRRVHPAQGARRARDPPQLAARLAVVRRLGPRPSDRRRHAALHPRGKAARRRRSTSRISPMRSDSSSSRSSSPRVATWMHSQPGTSDLRALVYFDEIFGFAPPTAAPPAKKPILTLMKQARAFGIGIVVATQNPVDLDYKAMANAGSWFVGRLQTERDKERVLEGLRSAAGGVDVSALDTAIGGLEQRQFLLQSTHRGAPELFSTRWAMSYLRGPLTKEQIETLTPDAPVEQAPAPAAPAAAPLAEDESAVAPEIAEGIQVRYLDPAAPWASSVGATPTSKRLQPFLAVRVGLRFDEAAAGLDATQEWEALYGPIADDLDLDDETAVDFDERDFRPEPPDAAAYVLPAAPLGNATFFRDAAKELQRRLVDLKTLELFRNRELGLWSRPGETREQFELRADDAAKARADEAAAKIRDRLEQKRDRLDRALETARRRVEASDVEQRSRKSTELLSGLGSVVGVLLGGKADSRTIARAGRALGGAASRRGMTTRAGERKRSAEARVEDAEVELEELEQELLDEVSELDEAWAAKADAIEVVPIRLESTDVRVLETTLLWVPSG